MRNSIIVIPGSREFDSTLLEVVAKDFNWLVLKARDLREAVEMEGRVPSVAVVASRDAAGGAYSWLDTFRLLRRQLPEARQVLCHGFGDAFDWPKLCDAGAFHALRVPFQEDEVRQSFGFIWEAEKRSTTARPTRVIAAA